MKFELPEITKVSFETENVANFSGSLGLQDKSNPESGPQI